MQHEACYLEEEERRGAATLWGQEGASGKVWERENEWRSGWWRRVELLQQTQARGLYLWPWLSEYRIVKVAMKIELGLWKYIRHEAMGLVDERRFVSHVSRYQLISGSLGLLVESQVSGSNRQFCQSYLISPLISWEDGLQTKGWGCPSPIYFMGSILKIIRTY